MFVQDFATWVLLAQEQVPQGANGAARNPLFDMLPLMVGIVFLYIFLIHRPQKKERETRESMLKSLKKNDRVLTSGGIYGVVSNVRPEVDEITIKVDEAVGAKLRMSLGAIARVIRDDAPEEKAAK